MISERERRALAEIERQLTGADPRFAKAMSRGTPRGTMWPDAGCLAVIVLACLSALLCLALGLIGSAAVAVLLAAAAHQVRVRMGR
jgi:Protein of unknown function (DUF3040)